MTVSILTLTFISIDRFRAICFPLRYKPQPGRAVIYIAIIWLIGLVADLPEFFALHLKKEITLRFDINFFTQCAAEWSQQEEFTMSIIKAVFLYTWVKFYLKEHRNIFLCILSLFYYHFFNRLPLFLMTIAYCQIIRVLWRSETIPGCKNIKGQKLNAYRSEYNPKNVLSTCDGDKTFISKMFFMSWIRVKATYLRVQFLCWETFYWKLKIFVAYLKAFRFLYQYWWSLWTLKVIRLKRKSLRISFR